MYKRQFKFQAGIRDGRLKDVSDYFEGKFKTLTDAGVRLGYRENYLPQLWEDDPDKVFETFRRLGLKPSFSLERVLENYQAGIREGLKPKFKDIGDLIGWYEGRANKAMADRAFFDHLMETGQVLPKGKAPSHWKTLDPDHFPVQKFRTKTAGKETVYEGALAAPKEVATKINNYLGEANPLLEGAAKFASLSKNFAMSAGVPFTGINAHGFNIMARTIIGNPREALRVGKYLINPKSAARDLEVSLKTAPWAVRKGLTLTTEGHEIGTIGSTNLGKKAVQGLSLIHI